MSAAASCSANRKRRNRPHAKQKKPKTNAADKENISNKVASMRCSSFGGKAGRAAYPILVGEAANLYKTHQLRQRKKTCKVTLDLHGCTRDEAKKMLNEGLQAWIDSAMKGDYPFVIPVDIVCGGGNQILSDLVAQFIRDETNVAKRPRGLT